MFKSLKHVVVFSKIIIYSTIYDYKWFYQKANARTEEDALFVHYFR